METHWNKWNWNSYCMSLKLLQLESNQWCTVQCSPPGKEKIILVPQSLPRSTLLPIQTGSRWRGAAAVREGLGRDAERDALPSKQAANKPTQPSMIKYMHKCLQNIHLTTLRLLKSNTLTIHFLSTNLQQQALTWSASKVISITENFCMQNFPILLPGSPDNHTKDFCRFIPP